MSSIIEQLTDENFTKEQLANYWKEYYEWLKKIYLLESFEIKGKNESLFFYHWFNNKDDDENILGYDLREKEYAEYKKKEIALNLKGEQIQQDEKKEYEQRGFICIDKEKKIFDFGIHYKHKGKGYAKAIYDNYLNILEMMGIEDREQYELRVQGNSNHDFLKRMHTRKMVKKAKEKPNSENAMKILMEFAQYPYFMTFDEFNTIIEYAINSNISKKKIAESINENGFKIFYPTMERTYFNENDIDKFKSFEIKGLKATCMHERFMEDRHFAFIQLITDANKEDILLEFNRILNIVKQEHEEKIIEEKYIPTNLKKFGEFGYIILDWDYSGMLFKYVDSEIQEFVKRKVLEILKRTGSNPKYSRNENLTKIFVVLSEAGLLDLATYIALYEEARKCNCGLEEFRELSSRYVDKEILKEAKKKADKNTECKSLE